MTGESLLDIEVLDESVEIGADGLRELIDMYYEQADDILAGLKEAIDKNHPETVDHLAHKLAGSSAVCGLNGMIGPLRALEKLGRERQLSDAGKLMASVNERLDLCKRALDEYLAGKIKQF